MSDFQYARFYILCTPIWTTEIDQLLFIDAFRTLVHLISVFQFTGSVDNIGSLPGRSCGIFLIGCTKIGKRSIIL